jgi:hypothetical protein
MRSTNREIRLLLRLLRRPHALEREPLAIMLREALHAESAYKAVIVAIETAFDQASPSGRQLKEIVRRCDIDCQTTTAAAADMNLSVRQFFRYRTDAVEAIAQSVGRSLRQPDDSSRKQLVMASMVAEFDSRAALDMYVRAAPSPTGQLAFEIARTAIWAGVDPAPYIAACTGAWRLLAQATQARRLLSIGMRAESEALVDSIRVALAGSSGPLYDAAAFEIAELDRRAVRRRGAMHDEAHLVERMRKLAHDDARLVALAMLAQAESACSFGELERAAVAIADAERIATERRDLYVLARSAYASATLAMLRGHLEDALALFNAAASTIAAFDAAYALRSAAFAGRCALQLERRWTPPLSLMERHPGSWIVTELECVEARRLIGSEPARALEMALATLRRSETTDAVVATLFARATVAAALDRTGDTAEAKKLWLACWTEGMRSGDQTTLFDLFAVPGSVERDCGPLAIDDAFLEAVQRSHEERFPTHPSAQSADVRTHKLALLRLSLESAVGNDTGSRHDAAVVRETARALLALRLTRDRVVRLGHSTSRAMSVEVSWLLPPAKRASFRAALLARWDRYIAEIVAQMGG